MKVFWTQDEIQTLAKAFVSLVYSNSEVATWTSDKPLFSRRTLWLFTTVIQEQLPANRQRNIASWSNISWPLMLAIKEHYHARLARLKDAGPDTTPPMLKSTDLLAVPGLAMLPEAIEAISEQVTDRVFELVKQRLVLEGWMQASVKTKAMKPVSAPDAVKIPAQTACMRVLVYGVKPNQAMALVSAWNGKVKFDCLGSDTKIKSKAHLPAVDYCIVMTKFACHASSERLRAHYGNRTVLTTGAVTAVSKLVNDLYAKFCLVSTKASGNS